MLRRHSLCLAEKAPDGFWCSANLRFGGDLVPAVGAAVRFLKPLLDTMVSEDVFAFGQPQRCFVDSLWVWYTELVVADDTSYLSSVRPLSI